MLPWIPRISYGSVVFDLSLPQRPWTPVSVGVGGYEESAAGVPSAWEYRRDEQRRLRLRILEEEWPEVWAWLIHAQRAGQFGFAPDRSGTSYTCYLVSPRMGEPIEPQPGDSAGVWEIELVIRTVSGAVIPGRYYGLEPLIVYEPGQRPSILHSSRTSPALYRDRDGVYREAPAGVLRDGHWRRDASGLLVQATLLEPGATNLIPWSEDFGQWSTERCTVTPESGGGYRITAQPAASQVVGAYAPIEGAIPVGSACVVWAEVKRGNWDHLGVTLNGATTLQGQHVGINLASGEVTSQGASVGWVRLKPLPGGWLQVAVHYPAASGGAASRRPSIRLISAGSSQTMTGDGSEHVLVRAAQCVLGTYASSLVRTTGVAASRDTDSLYLDLPAEIATPGTPLAIYARTVVEADSVAIGGHPGLWGISASTGSAPRLHARIMSDSGRANLYHQAHADGAAALAGPAIGVGDLLETLALIWTDSAGNLTGRLIACVNRGPLSAADLPPLAPAAAWSAPRLYVGSRGTAPGVYEYERLAVAAGRIRGSDQELMSQARTWRMGVR